MTIKKYVHATCATALLLALSNCEISHRSSARETIFDRVISIPKELVLDIPQLPPLCDENAGLKKGFIEVGQAKLYYEEEGNGIPLILLNPGPGGTHQTYHPYFSQLKNVARVIYYDARGTGQSSVDHTGSTYTIKQAVQDIEIIRKALKIDKWIVLGWSFGGFLAQCYALTYPEHMIGLILVAAADGLTTVKMKPDRQKTFLSEQEKKAIAIIREAEHTGKLTLEQGVYNAHLAGDWKRQNYYKPTLEEFIRMARYEWKPAPGFREIIGHDIAKINLDGKFEDFEVPTLLLEAAWDLTWDTDKAALIHKNHPHAQFHYFKQSGHCIFSDEPELFFNIVKEFLVQAGKTVVTCKPGNRLTWPKQLSPLALKIIIAGSLRDQKKRLKELLILYQQASAEQSTDATVWIEFFSTFFGKKELAEKALNALQNYEKFEDFKELPQYGHCLNVWKGELLDALGRQKEAKAYYQEALKNYKEVNNHCDNIDRKWLEEHINATK